MAEGPPLRVGARFDSRWALFIEQDVGKPGIPPGTDAQRWSRAHEIAGSNPAVLTFIAVGPVLVRVGGC